MSDQNKEIMRELIGGEGPPIKRHRFVPTAELQEALRGVGPIDPKRFREDVDEILDHDPTPRWRES